MGQSCKALNFKHFTPPIGGAAISSFIFSLILKRKGHKKLPKEF